MSLDYQKYYEDGWKNKPDRSTPVVAEALNNIDDAIIEIEDVLKQGVSEDATIVLTGTEFEPFFANKGNILIHEMLGKTVQDGIPSPTNPVDMKSVKVDLTTRSKNLYPNATVASLSKGITVTPKAHSVVFSGTASGDIGIPSVDINKNVLKLSGMKVGDKLTLSYMILDGSATISSNTSIAYASARSIPPTYSALTNKDGIKGKTTLQKGDRGSKVITLDADYFAQDGNVYFFVQTYFRSGDVCNNLEIAYVIELGDTMTDYVDSEYSVADTSIILRSIGDVKDKLFFEDGKFFVERRINEVKLSDVQSTVFASTGNDGADTKCYRWELDRFNSPNGTRAALCNVNEISLNSNDIKSGKGSVLISGNVLYGYLSIPNTITTTSDANEFIVDNNVSVIYQTDVQIIEEVSTDDAIKLLSLMAFDGETHIIQDSVTKGETVLEYPNNRVGGLALTGFCKSTKNEIKIDTIDALMTTMLDEEV